MSVTPPTTNHEPTHQRETPEDPMAKEPEGEARRQVSEPISACGNCRRRKLKCSKELPKCQQCRKTAINCEYDMKRNKTGMKPGAIENLHRKIDALETRVQSQENQITVLSQRSQSPRNSSDHASFGPNDYSILSFFAKQLRRFNDGSPDEHQGHDGRGPSAKRQRTQYGDNESIISRPHDTSIPSPAGPDAGALGPLLKAYFSHIHPWIPMIHEGRLRKRLSGTLDPDQRHRLHVILVAIRLTAARFIEDGELASACVEESREKQSQVRDWVVLQAMKQPCVESLQALIILAFHDIGCGEASLAWSMIGSLTRTAEYLQLTNEDGGTGRQSQSLVQPFTFLQPPENWTEEEERRRVFWNIFNLDRYCSVTMGWNTSLTSRDVNRKLPSDGIIWRKESQSTIDTPYFGIWDSAASRIGNPITYLPSHFNKPTAQSRSSASTTQAQQQQHPHLEHPTPSDGGVSSPATSSFSSPAAAAGASAQASSAAIDMSAVGAFAYSIEATESLSRVNTYFLQQPCVHSDQDLPGWITRFKELDLRLVHWKMFLPHKWKADNVTSRLGPRMDPNLTLAHITHNTSMIMLHQVIAFPLPEWAFFKHRLPSALSIATCQEAAIEISTIARNFLQVTEKANDTMAVAPQFSFCVYIAARFLLSLWRVEGGDLLPSFWDLLSVLEDVARRWSGPHGLSIGVNKNLPAKYAHALRNLHAKCGQDPNYRLDPLGYTTEIDPSSSEAPISPAAAGHDPESVTVARDAQPNLDQSSPTHIQRPAEQNGMMPGIIQPTRPLTQFQPPPGPLWVQGPDRQSNTEHLATAGHQNGANANGGGMELISHMLMDPQFMDLDRVISYDDGLFGPGLENASW